MKIPLIAGAVMLAATCTAHASGYTFGQATAICTSAVQTYVEPSFGAYVVNDGTDSHLREFGTASSQFRFEYCMNHLGRPLSDWNGQ